MLGRQFLLSTVLVGALVSLVEQLETQIDAFAEWCAPLLCELKMQDVGSFRELPVAVLKKTPGKFYIRYCKTHKRYHLYTSGALHRVSAVAGMQHFAALMNEHKVQLSKVERAALGQRLVRQHGLFHVAAQRDRQRYVEWRQFLNIDQQSAVVRAQDQVNQRGLSVRAAQLSERAQAEFYRCARKQVYAFREQAVAALAAKGEFSGSERMSVYSCEFCSGFHMGHEPRSTAPLAGDELRRKTLWAVNRYRKKSVVFLLEQGIGV